MHWQEDCEHPQLQNLPFKIEFNQFGNIVMSPAKNIYSVIQGEIQRLLYKQLGRHGKIIPECSMLTSDNIKVADVAWVSPERYTKVKHEITYSIAPELCIEVMSDGNAAAEMEFKRTLYLAAGAEEFWLCSTEGNMQFFASKGAISKSRLVPNFPTHIEL